MKINYKEVTITTTCPFCGHINEVAVNKSDYWEWQNGALVQDAFPYLTADERETLVSGICPACWDRMFSFPNDEEDDELFDDCDYEMGFDPYLGCFSDDC